MEKEKTDKMKAPDKIYLAESDNIRGEVTSNFASSTPFRRHNSIAYIREGFLIDKLAHAKALREKSGSKDTEVFDALINLIQEI